MQVIKAPHTQFRVRNISRIEIGSEVVTEWTNYPAHMTMNKRFFLATFCQLVHGHTATVVLTASMGSVVNWVERVSI